ncbi:MAG: aldehyde ferredoxin oxidoreductase family protein, partial [Planctomycetota bacterium]
MNDKNNGCAASMLTVDLSDARSRIEPFDDAFARTWLGANGFAAKTLYDRLAPATPPLSPENIVIFGVGPVTDAVPGSSRGYVAAKSPLTGLYCDSAFGGRFPVTQKRTGFESIALTGKAPSWVTVIVDENGAALEDARSLAGKSTHETALALGEKFGPHADVAAIGPAGENGVLYACISHFWKGRPGIAGRGGLGALLAAKNVKAVVVTGKKKTRVADPAALKALLDERRPTLMEKAKALSKYGTPALTEMINKLGGLAARNAQREFTPDVSQAGTEAMSRLYLRHTACFGCPVACGKFAAVPSGPYAGTQWKVAEYETIYALGAMLDCFDAPFLVRANQLCDELGIDTISLGVTLSFAAECLEKGFLTPRDVGHEQLFGNPAAILKLIEDTAHKRAFGEKLAMGSARLSRSLPEETQRFLYAVKDLEIAGHSPRALKGMGLGYATSTRGGSHHDTRPTTMYAQDHDNTSIVGQARLSLDSQHATAVGDSLTLCRFISERMLGPKIDDNWARLLRAVTGWDIDAPELHTVGERIYNLERLFNLREGASAKDDVLPHRVTDDPIPDGPLAGARCSTDDLLKMRKEYYDLRGWNADGVPTPATLKRLSLSPSLVERMP